MKLCSCFVSCVSSGLLHSVLWQHGEVKEKLCYTDIVEMILWWLVRRKSLLHPCSIDCKLFWGAQATWIPVHQTNSFSTTNYTLMTSINMQWHQEHTMHQWNLNNFDLLMLNPPGIERLRLDSLPDSSNMHRDHLGTAGTIIHSERFRTIWV